MLVFPFIFGYPRWLYLLLFFAFLIAAFLFNRFLRYSLRNGPRWGKSSAPSVTPRPAATVSPRPAPTVSPRPAATVTPPSSATVTPRSASSARPAGVRPSPVSRFAYCRRYADLLALCDGSVVRADRLVDVEAKGSPSAAPDVWVNLAISRFPSVR